MAAVFVVIDGRLVGEAILPEVVVAAAFFAALHFPVVCLHLD